MIGKVPVMDVDVVPRQLPPIASFERDQTRDQTREYSKEQKPNPMVNELQSQPARLYARASTGSTASLYSSSSVEQRQNLPPPPPPAAYHTNEPQSKDLRHDVLPTPRSSLSQADTWRDDDPIPPPPAKYTYSLPSISEALGRFEAADETSRVARHAPPPPQPPPPPLAPSYTSQRVLSDVPSKKVYQEAEPSARTSYTSNVVSGVAPTSAPTAAQHLMQSSPAASSPDVRRTSVEQTRHYQHESPYRDEWKSNPSTAPNGHSYRGYYHHGGYPNGSIHDPSLSAASRGESTAYAPSLASETPASSITHKSVWHGSGLENVEDEATRKPYGESVKRHLEVFDLEQSLNGIAISSREINSFSEYYRQKAHEVQRAGPVQELMPHLHEIDDMMHKGSRIQESLGRIRDVVVSQQAEQAQISRDKASQQLAQEMESANHEDIKGNGGFAGPDSKKRRGRAAPPGKCHSCNRVDTPEWRRGPDGARTLCNACGLHYAKLTRKAGTKPTSNGSNLRPKEGSPSG